METKLAQWNTNQIIPPSVLRFIKLYLFYHINKLPCSIKSKLLNIIKSLSERGDSRACFDY